MARFLTPVLLLLVGVGDYAGEPARPLIGPGAPIGTMAVPLVPGDPAVRRVGALTFVAGWQLTSADPAFGGVSAMAVAGRRFTLLSDAGSVMAFDLDEKGRASRVRFTDLSTGPGVGWSKDDRDTESLAMDPASGRAWVGYEGFNQIWRYAPGFTRAEAAVAPPEMADWPTNSGAEAMARLRSGRFVVIAEAPGADGTHAGLLFAGDPTRGERPVRFRYAAPRWYRVTDMAELPDGRLLILHRNVNPRRARFGWRDGRVTLVAGVSALVTAIDPRAITPGMRLMSTEVARIGPPLNVENYEAMAVTQEGGRTMVWIASDDNFAWYQRTLLMQFALDPAVPGRAARVRRP
ncbi:esterase-like activity of phytase family protein [Sphingomonas flavalba]|uniref:esterase-like activity of phytase family protein n=1 Tax=Sphingomonas flavalba TaxID=2559804 RepID=UPI0039DFD350